MLPVHIAAPVAVEPDRGADRCRRPSGMDRSGQFALIAAREAWADAGAPEVDARAHGRRDRLRHRRRHHAARRPTTRSRSAAPAGCSPMTVPMLMPNGPAAVVGLELGARAGVHTPVSACSSGAEAIAYAVDMIRSGRADVVVAGGTEAAIHVLPLAGFAAMQALSTRNDEPERASRPYDKGRDGFVLGEGAGVVVLETAGARQGARRHDLRRGRRARHHVRRPPHRPARPGRRGRRPRHADGRARRRRRRRPTSCTSTRTPPPPRSGDVAEVQAIRAALGDATDGACVTATKSMTGHLLGAAGAVEAIATILALHDRTRPGHHQPRGPRRRRHARRRRAARPAQLPDGRHRRAQQLVRLRRPQRRPRVPDGLTAVTA